MIKPPATIARTRSTAKTRKGEQRYKCNLCGGCLVRRAAERAGRHAGSGCRRQTRLALALRGFVDSQHERLTGIHRDTLCKLLVLFGDACREFLDERMRGSRLTHLQFDEQWTYVAKKQSRLTMTERAESSRSWATFTLWTCIDQKTKLMPGFLIGKRIGRQCPAIHDGHCRPADVPESARQRRPLVQAGRLSHGRPNLNRRLSRATARPSIWLSAPMSSTARSSRNTATRR